MQEVSDDDKGVATCILCGKPLQGLQVVKYRTWNVHAECAQNALERQVDNFNRTPFWIGSLGVVFGILFASPILLTPPSGVADPTLYWVTLVGMAIGLLFQSVGFYGFASNYDEGTGIICSILAIVAAVAHLGGAITLIQFGYDPLYHDPVTGIVLLYSIPNMLLILVLSFGLLLLLMAFIGIMVMLLGESVTFGFNNRIVAVIFVGAAALMPMVPLNFFIEMILVTVLFLSARVPEEWTKIDLK